MIVQGLNFTVVNTSESRLKDGESNSSIVLGEIMEVMTPEKVAFWLSCCQAGRKSFFLLLGGTD